MYADASLQYSCSMCLRVSRRAAQVMSQCVHWHHVASTVTTLARNLQEQAACAHLPYALANNLASSLLQPTAAFDAFPTSRPLAQPTMRRLASGHTATVYACAAHPSAAHVYATASDECEVRIWHAHTRAQLGSAIATSAPARSLDFSPPQGRHLAVGLLSGAVAVYDRDRALVCERKYFGDEVGEVRYSPDGSVLAAGSDDLAIDLYNVSSGYQRYARCRGHSAAVLHLDFSLDGRVLQSSCNAYEVRGSTPVPSTASRSIVRQRVLACSEVIAW